MEKNLQKKGFKPPSALRAPVWLWPNLLSLDAPIVAVVWMWMLAKALRVEYIQSQAWWVLGISIWVVYVLDRIQDAWTEPEKRNVTARHYFHWKFRWPLLVLVAVASVWCIYQALYVLPSSMFSAGLVAVLLCGAYFLLARYHGPEVPWVKNFLAGMIFAMGIGIPINAANASLLVTDLQDVIYAFKTTTTKDGVLTGVIDGLWNLGLMVMRTVWVIFYDCREVWVLGLLCMMNITAIDLWERADAAPDEESAYSHEATLTLGLIILAAGCLIFAAFRADEYSKPFFYAVMIAAALMQGLNHFRLHFSLRSLRVLADVALLLPLPVFLFA